MTTAKNVVVENGKQEFTLAQMRYGELEEYINERRYAIGTTLYGRTDELRDAIEEYEHNKEEFLISQEKKREQIRIARDLAALDEINAAQENSQTQSALDI